MKILHLADCHLDRPFRGLEPEAARRARGALFEAFCRALEAAREHAVDLVTIGGDLWEDEHVSADTVRSVARVLEELGLPVLAVAGNHDPVLPGGPYDRAPWPATVAVVRSSEPVEHRYDGVSVWAVSWTGGRLQAGFLDSFSVPDDGRTHLLLLHGTCREAVFAGEEGEAVCPFSAEQVRRAGFAACLAGHRHRALWREGVLYPGSPEPLGFGEEGEHCYALVEVGSGVRAELVPVSRLRFQTLQVDVGGAASSAEVRARVEDRLPSPDAGTTTHLRLRLVGAVEPGCAVVPEEVEHAFRGRFASLRIEDRTSTAYDLDALVSSPTVEGRFAAALRERAGQTEGRQRQVAELALRLGLHAFRGERLPDVG